MKKEGVILFLLGILLVLPLVLAQEQAQTYSGFERFADNFKMFFSFGDNKVMLALEIKEKEVYSAIENNGEGNEEDMSENLENAWKKLQVIQKKVSLNVAEQVKTSSSQIRERISQEENLSKDFELYSLEEEKTELTAEWVVEVEGKEGQTLKKETEGIVGEEGKNKTIEIETRIGEIDEEIKHWVVDNVVEVEKDNGLTWEVATKIVKEDKDDGLTREIKTHVAGDGKKDNDVAPGPQGIVGTVDSSDAVDGSGSGTNEVAEGDGGEGDYAEGTTAEGVDAGETTEENNDDASVDSDEESSNGESGGEESSEESAPVTGEVIGSENKESFLGKILNKIF